MYRYENLKFNNDLVIRGSLFISIFLTTFIFYYYPEIIRNGAFNNSDYTMNLSEQIIVPPTQQDMPQYASLRRPSVVIPSDNEDIADDLTIEDLSFDDFEFNSFPPPPINKSGPKVKFIPYDEPPVPLGGIKAIQERIIYPEIALLAGIQGIVIVQAYIDEKGRVRETLILKGIDESGLNEAAMTAIRKSRFKPAKQRDQEIAVWMSIPINFKIYD
ncbi:MAG: energy transducer TonB [Candidatus Marinimicrobia bacterium]|jgi:protein TonB|nr:energy transducer TonB [Candidatus Neomarinimicrobiota bacterium]MBT3839909.1 energy transducer TonB [Candidatus Neomarinimicrobiota bacterium]MBT3998476.1 energy transducer TonB [Candidatus Neomarinimicrobiota bacterium]MBT4281706.1 energy transducer TonB [Candidatus Neomarinimicrobiota bacterium]MBT4579330.1 energy transducer TonB [Candidatus Neomarinimicrobiota bacterium]